MWRKIRLGAENARPVAFERSEGHRRRGGRLNSRGLADFSPIRFLAVDFDLAGPKERFIAPSSKTSRASVESMALSLQKSLGARSNRRGKSEKLALSIPGEWQFSLTPQ